MGALLIMCWLGGSFWKWFCRLADVSEKVEQSVMGLWLLLCLYLGIQIAIH